MRAVVVDPAGGEGLGEDLERLTEGGLNDRRSYPVQTGLPVFGLDRSAAQAGAGQPPEIWSRVVVILASRTGWRNWLHSTMCPTGGVRCPASSAVVTSGLRGRRPAGRAVEMVVEPQ